MKNKTFLFFSLAAMTVVQSPLANAQTASNSSSLCNSDPGIQLAKPIHSTSLKEIYDSFPAETQAQIRQEMAELQLEPEALEQLALEEQTSGQLALGIRHNSFACPIQPVARDHLLYAGLRFGWPFLTGAHLSYVKLRQDAKGTKPVYLVEAEANSSYFLNNVNIGFEIGIGRKGFMIGARGYDILFYNPLIDTAWGKPLIKQRPGAAIEFAHTYAWGKKRRVLTHFRVGVAGFPSMLNPGNISLFPDAKIGVGILLFGTKRTR